MGDIERYSPVLDYDPIGREGLETVAAMRRYPDGEYVLYTDYLKTQEMLQEVERQRRELQRELDVKTETFKRSRYTLYLRLDALEQELKSYKEMLKDGG